MQPLLLALLFSDATTCWADIIIISVNVIFSGQGLNDPTLLLIKKRFGRLAGAMTFDPKPPPKWNFLLRLTAGLLFVHLCSKLLEITDTRRVDRSPAQGYSSWAPVVTEVFPGCAAARTAPLKPGLWVKSANRLWTRTKRFFFIF